MIAETLVSKMEKILVTETQNLLQSRGIANKWKNTISAFTRNINMEPVAYESDVAHALLYLVELLAREFGDLPVFRGIEDISTRLVGRSNVSSLERLRFKSVSLEPV
jgi:hypothetical protein